MSLWNLEAGVDGWDGWGALEALCSNSRFSIATFVYLVHALEDLWEYIRTLLKSTAIAAPGSKPSKNVEHVLFHSTKRSKKHIPGRTTVKNPGRAWQRLPEMTHQFGPK